MIVFVEPDKGLVNVYTDEGKEIFSYDDVDELKKFIGTKKVLYVVKAVQTNAKAVVELVSELEASSDGVADDSIDALNRKTYFIRSTKKGTLHVHDAGITFSGPGDCKVLDADMYEKVKTSIDLRELIQKKIIEIISYTEMKRIMREVRKEQAKKAKLKPKNKTVDASSGVSVKILDSHDDVDMAGDDDVETVDMTSDVKAEEMGVRKLWSESKIKQAIWEGKIDSVPPDQLEDIPQSKLDAWDQEFAERRAQEAEE